MKNIKKYIGEIIIVMGGGLFSYNAFNFSYRVRGGGNDYLFLGAKEMAIVYYYSLTSLWLISIGIMLIILGILIIKKKNEEFFKTKLV